MFPRRGRFVNSDLGHALVTKAAGGKFRVSYLEPDGKKIWKNTVLTSLKSAVDNLTGRGFYLHGPEDTQLVTQLSGMDPAAVRELVPTRTKFLRTSSTSPWAR